MKVNKYQKGSMFFPTTPNLQSPLIGPTGVFTSPLTPQTINQSPTYTLKNKMEFGSPNYNWVAGSNAIKSIAGFLSEKQREKEFQQYDRVQSNPLSILPYSPNTSDQSLYGQSYFQMGGTAKVEGVRQVGFDPNRSFYQTSQIDKDARLADLINQLVAEGYDPYTSQEGRNLLNVVPVRYGDAKFASDLGLKIKTLQSDSSYKNLTPEQRLERFYSTNSDSTDLDKFINRARTIGGSPGAYYQNSPLSRKTPTIKFKKGGKKQYGGFISDEIEQELESDIMGETNQIPSKILGNTESEQINRIEEDESINELIRDPNRFSRITKRNLDEEVYLPEMGSNLNSSVIETFKKGISNVESGGNYFAKNPKSSAYGKYQFIKGTREAVRQSFFPNMSKKEFENSYKTSPQFQEKVMDAYSGYLLGKYKGDMRRAATAFFLGEGNADKVSNPNYRPNDYNLTVGDYLKKTNFQTGGNVTLGPMVNQGEETGTIPIYKPTKETIRVPVYSLLKKPTKKEVLGKVGEVKEFFEEYLNSPKYMERLEKQKYQFPLNVRYNRQIRLIRSPEFKITDGVGNQYDYEKNKILLDPAEMQLWGFDPGATIAHELSHRIGANSGESIFDTGEGNTNLNTREIMEFQKRNKVYHTWPEHDARAWENKADIDSLRYLLKRDKLYDAGTQDFTPEVLKKAKERYYKDHAINRLFNYFSDEDLIWLMNNIASNNKKVSIPEAQEGGSLPPIRVYDRNDPRLKAYRDSLHLFNQYPSMTFGDFYKLWNNKHEGPIFQDDDYAENDKYWFNKGNKTGINPINAFLLTDAKLQPELVYPIYKKPVQPVEFISRRPVLSSRVQEADYSQAPPNVLPSGKFSDLSQKPTKYFVTYRDESSPSKQNTAYFKTREMWKNVIYSGLYTPISTSQTEDSAMAAGYLNFKKGGYYYADGGEIEKLKKLGYDIEIIN